MSTDRNPMTWFAAMVYRALSRMHRTITDTSTTTARSSSRRTKVAGAALAVVCLTTAVTVGAAGAGHKAEEVVSYTGCLTRGGTLVSIQVGDQPTRPCERGAVVAHFSGGDITEILAGTGLTGGAINGAATIALAPSFQLPQACTAGQVAEWDGSGWSCADDDTGTDYTAGEGLELNGTEFSIDDLYQLPQDCELGQGPVLIPGLSSQLQDWGCATHVAADQACPSGQFARAVDDDGELGCATPPAGSGGSTAYLAVARNPIDGSESIGILSNNQPFEMVRLDLPPGTYTFAASGTVIQEEYEGPAFRDSDEGCALSAAGTTLQLARFDNHALNRQISLISAAQLPTGGAVSVVCRTTVDGYVGQGFRLVATSVGALG